MGDYRETLLAETREELAKADAKASILLAASGIIVGALVAIGGSNAWSPAHLEHFGAKVLAWIAIGLTVIGILFVSAAVKPRLRAKRSPPGKPFYFGDVESYRPRWWHQLHHDQALSDDGRARLQAALAALTDEDLVERLDDQIWTCSHIAYRKYKFLSVGMWCYAGSFTCAVLALMVEKRWP